MLKTRLDKLICISKSGAQTTRPDFNRRLSIAGEKKDSLMQKTYTIVNLLFENMSVTKRVVYGLKIKHFRVFLNWSDRVA